ncbi:MAG: hypothetical protein GXY99_02065 [Clostridiaceae bacterium]|jgi:hypothetical protein|nr:hypothetical protein [Clostridiaceae bacterium]
MVQRNTKRALLFGGLTAGLSFTLFLIALKFVLGTRLLWGNVIGLLVLSLILGLISLTLYLLNLKIAFYVFSGGLVLAFIFMILSYGSGPGAWGDLIGALAFIFLTLLGLVGGLIAQLIVYLVQKQKS